jgi:hypothetical protein
MKKYLLIFAISITAFTTLLAACGGQGAPASPTVVWLSDTQHLSYSKESIDPVMQKIADEQKKENIVYVTHTGDIVQNADDEDQWNNMRAGFDILEKAGIPYGTLAGNHDQGNAVVGMKNYNKYFGEARSYDTVTLGEKEFIFVYLSDDPELEDVAWAKATFDENADKEGVLCVHDYLEEGGCKSPMGEYLAENIVSPCKNIRMVLSGHEENEITEEQVYEGRTVIECGFNKQNTPGAHIRLIHYNPETDTFTFETKEIV